MKYLLILPFILVASNAFSQPTNIPCSNNIWNPVFTNQNANIIYACGPLNTWVIIPTIQPGTISFVTTGNCPTGWTEITELNGKTLVGTLAANGNVGTTGGLDSITPAGTNNALIFTGTPITFTEVINHTHAVTSVGSAATGSTTNLTGASDTSSTTATAVNPSGGVASFVKTPAGSINTPVFTGTQFDNRSAFTRVIFCRKS